jgi:ATP-dependent Clp protease adaptor protein ClpS
MPKTEVKTTIKPDLTIDEPPLFKIIYINDEVTTMSFVVETLIDYFYYTEDTAVAITEKIHEEGSATVAVLPYEIAEQKGIEVTNIARTNGYPLKIMIESASS